MVWIEVNYVVHPKTTPLLKDLDWTTIKLRYGARILGKKSRTFLQVSKFKHDNGILVGGCDDVHRRGDDVHRGGDDVHRGGDDVHRGTRRYCNAGP